MADGVSCSNNAQQASQTSVTQFMDDYYSTNESWDVKKSAGKVLSSLNAWLYHHSKGDARHNGLITTFSSIIFKSTTAHIFHVGDSRIYRYREGVLTQLTKDHSRVTHGNNNVLIRALGMDCHVDIDYRSVSLQQGDIFYYPLMVYTIP
ncbi:PP2C family protein-serine/threonine phosphatase [Psychromonas sp. KJ10-10]|uniref:PP2C family protein-serine/threonine phosphatase n=1 Tax=Psychromonas sp. KJ10-10 TaxID=3391823 RepID=UPI0039B42FA9